MSHVLFEILIVPGKASCHACVPPQPHQSPWHILIDDEQPDVCAVILASLYLLFCFSFS